MKVEYEVDFHPVGQGLFSSGTIFYDSKEFLFVYDCGTSSPQKLIRDAIYEMKFRSKDSIDLLAISHFDNDHINGLDILFKEFSVDTLLLPYINLETRLILAFEEKIGITSKMMKFFLDPVEYITSEYQGKIKNIIMVPPTKGQVGEFQDGVMINDNFGLMGNVTREEDKNDVSIFKLKPNGIIGIKNIFEFIPYNDASLSSKLSPRFVSAIEKEKKYIVNHAGTSDSHMIAMSKIRDKYDLLFGKSSKKRNQISLFLFAGPIRSTKNYLLIHKKNGSSSCIESLHFECRKDCLLYTGDGYLNTKKQLQSLINYLGKNRLERIVCLQVMHHGARGCWHKGVANAISPLISLFSSEPHKFSRHPHAEVVKDFLPFMPMQVDSNNALNIQVISI